MSVITRFAPSPTGYLHIGGARTALFNYLFSKHFGGKFLLRIEDTDEKRSTNQAIDAIIQGLDWLGLKHDGDFVLQSKNIERHKEIAQKLLEKNQAYLCYVSPEELDEMRKNAENKKENFHFKSPWRDKFNSQSSTVKPAIRIKAPLEGETIIDDLVQGSVRVKNSELDDLVMLRGDGTPTYMLAVVVDDFDMGITHIIRGDDHLNNAFRQKVIYDAMGWAVPKFAHIPLIHGADGAKMSKRHGATSVIEYKDMGYLPESLRNYLLRLGFGYGDDEIIGDKKAIEIFDIAKVGKSPSRFDFAKLNHVNKHYIKEKSNEELFDLIENFLISNSPIRHLSSPTHHPDSPICHPERSEGSHEAPAPIAITENHDNPSTQLLSTKEKNRIIKALKFLREKPNTLKEIADAAQIYLDNFSKELSSEDKKILSEKKSIINDLSLILKDLQDWSHDGIKNAINEYAATKNLKIKDFGPALRIALTFSPSSAGGVFDVVEILGQGEVLKRMMAF